MKTQIQTLLMESVSSFDIAGENFYHGFMLGLCALLGGFLLHPTGSLAKDAMISS